MGGGIIEARKHNEPPNWLGNRSSEGAKWWTLDDRIRTESEFEVLGIVFVQDPYLYMQLASEASRLRKLGMTFREIAAALGTDDRLVRKAVAYAAKAKSAKGNCQ